MIYISGFATDQKRIIFVRQLIWKPFPKYWFIILHRNDNWPVTSISIGVVHPVLMLQFKHALHSLQIILNYGWQNHSVGGIWKDPIRRLRCPVATVQCDSLSIIITIIIMMIMIFIIVIKMVIIMIVIVMKMITITITIMIKIVRAEVGCVASLERLFPHKFHGLKLRPFIIVNFDSHYVCPGV